VRHVDLLVAGGGPVGLATALYARAAGLQVIVVEPRAGAVDKACGEGVMPSAVLRLASLGVVLPGRPFQGITYVDARGRRVTADFPHGPGQGVRRTALHAALRTAAHAAGVERINGVVEEVRQSATGVRVDVGGRTYGASYLAAADGLHSPLRHELGLDRPTRRHRRYGLRRHFTVAPWSDHVEVHWSEHAELYVTPVGGDVVGVAVLTSRRGQTYGQWLKDFPLVAEQLRGAQPASRVMGAGPLRQRAKRVVDGRVLLVGDAAGYVDALTGEGLAVGLAGAQALVDSLLVGRPQDYAHAWQEVTRTSRLLTETLLRSTRVPVLRRALVPSALAAPWVFRATVARLA
jgi:flavin-dependent dehydrogenase